jgi:hypothetical protein
LVDVFGQHVPSRSTIGQRKKLQISDGIATDKLIKQNEAMKIYFPPRIFKRVPNAKYFSTETNHKATAFMPAGSIFLSGSKRKTKNTFSTP